MLWVWRKIGSEVRTRVVVCYLTTRVVVLDRTCVRTWTASMFYVNLERLWAMQLYRMQTQYVVVGYNRPHTDSFCLYAGIRTAVVVPVPVGAYI